MVEIQIRYEGGLRTRAVHGPSAAALHTDAPLDNHGKGESFSPTDLVATALGSCMLTVMGIVAQRHGWKIEGSRVRVEKSMVSDPVRRIGKLEVWLTMAGEHDERARATLERTAHTCPVHQSLLPSVEIPVHFEWGAPAQSA
ncbi:MAG: OsmC family protein [Planctomycetes bacterium]|nr:OsmC family protein [Planctomycetota bacterium]